MVEVLPASIDMKAKKGKKWIASNAPLPAFTWVWGRQIKVPSLPILVLWQPVCRAAVSPIAAFYSASWGTEAEARTSLESRGESGRIGGSFCPQNVRKNCTSSRCGAKLGINDTFPITWSCLWSGPYLTAHPLSRLAYSFAVCGF